MDYIAIWNNNSEYIADTYEIAEVLRSLGFRVEQRESIEDEHLYYAGAFTGNKQVVMTYDFVAGQLQVISADTASPRNSEEHYNLHQQSSSVSIWTPRLKQLIDNPEMLTQYLDKIDRFLQAVNRGTDMEEALIMSFDFYYMVEEFSPFGNKRDSYFYTQDKELVKLLAQNGSLCHPLHVSEMPENKRKDRYDEGMYLRPLDTTCRIQIDYCTSKGMRIDGDELSPTHIQRFVNITAHDDSPYTPVNGVTIFGTRTLFELSTEFRKEMYVRINDTMNYYNETQSDYVGDAKSEYLYGLIQQYLPELSIKCSYENPLLGSSSSVDSFCNQSYGITDEDLL